MPDENEFRNTYHFAPVEKANGTPEELWRTSAGKFREHGPERGDSHAAYGSPQDGEPRWSGRVVCRLTAETPMVIGGAQERQGEDYAIVEPYEFGGKAAIPATTLKGLVSSIAEAASGSALRVLEHKKLGRSSANEFFRDLDPDLLPYHDEREHLTPAERLFGFVSGETSEGRRYNAYAGRVRFSVGKLETSGDPYDSSGDYEVKGRKLVRLKILASPKPPSPSLYFKHKDAAAIINGDPIAKHDLKLDAHEPQGRKFFLHHDADGSDPDRQPWRTKSPNANKNQKNAVRPVKAGTKFLFHVDFENLTKREIGLLAFALSPSEKFRHKIGMGKPIGLGTVRIDPLALFLMDRRDRYGADDVFAGPRWHAHVIEQNQTLPAPYDADLKHTRATAAGAAEICSLKERRDAYLEYAAAEKRWPAAINALLLIGETNYPSGSDGVPTHVPLVSWQNPDDKSGEEKTFKWSATNKKIIETPGDFEEPAQQLRPIAKDSKTIPVLRKLSGAKRQQPRRGR